MAKAAQLTLSLKSRPGVLAALARTLADARVNIFALSADTRAGRRSTRPRRVAAPPWCSRSGAPPRRARFCAKKIVEFAANDRSRSARVERSMR